MPHPGCEQCKIERDATVTAQSVSGENAEMVICERRGEGRLLSWRGSVGLGWKAWRDINNNNNNNNDAFNFTIQ